MKESLYRLEGKLTGWRKTYKVGGKPNRAEGNLPGVREIYYS